MKAPGDNKKLTAIQFCNSGKKLFEVDKICAKLVTNVSDMITRISLISKFKGSRWLGLIYVLPLDKDHSNRCAIFGTLHVAAPTRRELSEFKQTFAKSQLVDMAWVDEVSDWEISDRRGFTAADPLIYIEPP